jgi:two-component system chemotaxis response regulator CheY
MRILIVDDDKVSSDYLSRIFSQYGTCDIAINGIEAVDAFLLAYDEGSPYDLISLDLMLPLFDGEDVLSAIRKIEHEKKIEALKKVKVIITSALNDRELINRLSIHGFDEYFIKPIDAKRILGFIKNL